MQPTDVELAGGVDEHGEHVTVAFTLPAGAFATVLLGELMKSDAVVSERFTTEVTENTEGIQD